MGKALEKVLDLLDHTVVRKTVNDAEVVNLVAKGAILMGGAEPAVVRVEPQIFLSRVEFLLRHLRGSFVQRHRPLALDQHAQFTSLALVLEFRRCAHQHVPLGLVFTITTGLEDLKRLVAELLLVAALQIMDTNK